jgi:uncharacterized protein (TIGR03435 family)
MILTTALGLSLTPVVQRLFAEPQIGDYPPAIALERLLQAPEGSKATWAALKGKVVVLEFWATWCGPCVGAIPHLNELADAFKNKPVQFIAITDEDEKIITQFLKRKPIHAWVGLDTDKSMFKEYAVTGIPHTVIVDKKGRIVAITHPAALTDQILRDVLAGKRLALATPSSDRRDGIRPGYVPYSNDHEQTNLFQVLIRPTPPELQNSSSMASGNGCITIAGSTVFGVLSSCYNINLVRVITNAALPEGKFDFIIKTPSKEGDIARTWLRQAVEATFGLQAKRETRTVPVYILSSLQSAAGKFTPTVSTGGSSGQSGPGRLQAINQPVSSLAGGLESNLRIPVFDETGLTNHYDYEVKWKEEKEGEAKPEVIVQAVHDQLGLQLTLAHRPVEMVIIDYATKPKQE